MGFEQQREFLSQTPPFDSLNEKLLNTLADSMDVQYWPAKTRLEVTNASEDQALYFVIKGKVAEWQEGMITAQYGVRGYFGDAILLDKHQKTVVFEMIEEVIAYRLPKSLFLKALDSSESVSNFFNASIVEKLNRIHEAIQSSSSTEVMMDTVCSAPIQTLVRVESTESLLVATQKMMAVRSDACLVIFDQEAPGIVTSSDVLKFIASDSIERVKQPGVLAEIAHKPVYSVHEYDYLFNALLKMTRYQIDRLVVRDDKDFVGILHQKDLMSLFANQSGLVLIKVDQARSVDDLIEVGPQIDRLIQNLNQKGIKTHYIAKLVNELHRKMLAKLVGLLLPSALQDKVCLCVMGSEGRSEQVIRTDQDNALIFDDALSASEEEALSDFAVVFIDRLKQMGFPPCPGNIMLSNPEWRMRQSEFEAKIDRWFDQPSDDHFMNAAIFYDAESVFGRSEWLEQLKHRLMQKTQEYDHFLRHFAVATLRFPTPVGFFGGLVSETESGHDLLDIKKGGIFTLVHGVRCYALEAGIDKTNTHWRIKALMDQGLFEKEFGLELGETLNFLNTLRLQSMLEQLNEGVTIPNNKIRLEALSHMNQDLLKQSFHVVDTFKKRLTHHFNLHSMV
ncbi:MAG: DUF294 nucleotidyltransferase-like domain-containing protein [Hydrogenovibrio sp.]